MLMRFVSFHFSRKHMVNSVLKFYKKEDKKLYFFYLMFFSTKFHFESNSRERDEGDDTLYLCRALEIPFVLLCWNTIWIMLHMFKV